jgi:hypothetical protein
MTQTASLSDAIAACAHCAQDEAASRVRIAAENGLAEFTSDTAAVLAARLAYGSQIRVIDAGYLAKHCAAGQVGAAIARNPHPQLCVVGLAQLDSELAPIVARVVADHIKNGLSVLAHIPETDESVFEPLRTTAAARAYARH